MLNNKFVTKRLELTYKLITPFLKEKMAVSVLDVGGNQGIIYSDFFKKDTNLKKVEYHLVDWDKSLEIKVKNMGVIFHLLDLNKSKLTSIFPGGKKFDVIICTEVLEHLLYPELQFESFKKLLKKNGLMLISLPNEITIFHRLYYVFGIGADSAFTRGKHLHLPSLSQGEKFINKYCKIISKKYYVDFTRGEKPLFEIPDKLIMAIPLPVWIFIANFWPAMFARGTIFLCQPK